MQLDKFELGGNMNMNMDMDVDMKVKQDKNFIHYPLWFQENYYQKDKFIEWKDIDGYIYQTCYKLPKRTDWLFLLFILHESQESNWDNKVNFTKYQILTKCKMTISGRNYDRIEDSLECWIHVVLSFMGTFYSNKKYEKLQFNILNDWGINEETKKIEVVINEKFLLKIKESKYYDIIDLEEMVSMESALDTRLNELLKIQFYDRDEWKIDAVAFAKKIPIKQKFPSSIIRKIEPALRKVRKKGLQVYMHVIKQGRGKALLIFTKDRKYQEPVSETAPVNTSPKNEYEQILEEIPSKYKKRYKSLPDLLQKYMKSKGFLYVRANVIYSVSNSDGKFIGYLKKSLDFNHAEFGIAKPDPKIVEAKKEAKTCFKNPGNCTNGVWGSYTETNACYWCKRHKAQRDTAQEAVEVQSAPIVEPQPIQSQSQSQPQPLSEVDQLKQMMLQMQQKIQELEAEKSLPSSSSPPSPQQMEKKTVKAEDTQVNLDQIDKHQANPTTPLENRLLAKWWTIRAIIEKKIGTGLYNIFIYPLALDYSKSNESKLTLFALHPRTKEKIVKKYLKTIQDAAGDVEIVIEATSAPASGKRISA